MPLSKIRGALHYAALAMMGLVAGLLAAARVPLAMLLLFNLAYITFEGLFKNITGNHPVSYLARDGLLAILFARWYLERQTGLSDRWFATAFHRLLFIFVIISAVQIFNPLLDQYYWLVGLAGVHQRLLPMVLFLAAWETMREHRTFELARRVIVASAVLVGVVLLLQISLGQERWRALGFTFYAQGASDVPSEGRKYGVSRPASLAKDAGMAGWFLMAGAFATLGSLLRLDRSQARQWLFYALLTGFLVLCALLTYSRSVYLAMIAGVFVIALALPGRGRLRLLLAGGIGLMLAILALQVVPDAHTGAVMTRLKVSVFNPIGAFTAASGGRLNQLVSIPDVLFDQPVGIGAGRTGPGVSVLRRWFPGAQTRLYENAAGATALELGVPGFVIWVAIYGTLFWLGARTLPRLKDSEWQLALTWCLAMVAATFLASFAMNPWDAAPSNIYFWFVCGTLIRIAVRVRSPEESAESLPLPAMQMGGVRP